VCIRYSFRRKKIKVQYLMVVMMMVVMVMVVMVMVMVVMVMVAVAMVVEMTIEKSGLIQCMQYEIFASFC